MRFISYFFFYTYIGLVILAGFWGAFLNPSFDHILLFDLDTNTLPEFSRINMLSQYRFLRAIELGFGLFAITFTKNIFSDEKFNRLFLFIMASGVLARITSIIIEGFPGMLTYFFLFYELTGLIILYFYSRKQLTHHGGN